MQAHEAAKPCAAVLARCCGRCSKDIYLFRGNNKRETVGVKNRMQQGSDDILRALDAFIRKYYKNLVVRGLLLAIGIAGLVFLAAVLLEYYGWLPPLGRGLLFWGGLVAVFATVVWLVVRPLLKMHGLGKRLLRSEAARIVGRHFPEVDDKLLNLLQLVESEPDQPVSESPMASPLPSQSSLLVAAIEQKASQLRPVPILHAIDLKANRKYLKYAIPPLVVILILLLVVPQGVKGSAQRIAHYTTVYERPAPFAFVVMNKELQVLQGDDFELRVTTEGEAKPAEAWINIGGHRYRMRNESDTLTYQFKQVHDTKSFLIEGGGVISREYVLTVDPRPSMLSFRMVMNYPAYTRREGEVQVDLGDAVVPEGTVVKWLFQTRDADSVCVVFDSVEHQHAVDGNGRAEWSRRMMRDMQYHVSVGKGHHQSDTLVYTIAVVADAAPQIEVEEVMDSLHPDRRLFRGRIKDDYGFSRLVFVHRTTNGADATVNDSSEVEIGLREGDTQQEFYFSLNMAEMLLKPGDELGYWFEVADNDAIHGPKKTRSRQFVIKIPTEGEMDSILERNSTEVVQSADQQMSELRKLQEEINAMMQRLVDKKELGWQDKKDLEQLAEKQRQVRQMMQQMQQQIRENNRLEQKYREQSDQIMEKQRELDRLMNEVMDEKMKETMAQIERMMQELDKKKVQQELEQLKINNTELEQQLDQNIELMKRLELEKKVEQTVQKLDKLAAEQRELGEQTQKADKKQKDQLQQKQGELNEQFQQLENEIEQIKKGYKELDANSEFKVNKDLQKQVENKQKGAQQHIQQGKNSEAGKMQKEAADDIEKLSEEVAQAQTEMEQESLVEDAEQIRMLLKNLLHLSFNQEELIGDVASIYIQDPRYQTILVRQNRIKDDFKGVADSLRAVAKRQVQVASIITKELGEVNSGIARSLNGLLEMNQSYYGNSKNIQASRSMQYSMTSLNNLALVLSESLDNMQNQMRSNSLKMKNGQCKNPGKGNKPTQKQGSGKPSPSTIRQMQQELNRQMEALKKQLEEQGKGSKLGRHQIGQGQQMSKELARMAAEQEAIRRMMQQYGQDLKEESGGNSKLAREIEQMLRQMEQTETDLVNRTITRQTIQRQQQILTRLLEHEKADLQREKEQRRESREATEMYSQPSPKELELYKRMFHSADDQLRTVPPNLTPYYRNKVSEYFYR